MKKNVIVIILTITLIISIFFNIILVSRYNNAKEYALSAVYTDLKNITVILDNIEFSMGNDDKIDDYTLKSLEIICIQLDNSMYTLTSLLPGTISHENFKGFYNNLYLKVKDYNEGEIEISDISQYKIRIEELIAKLSPKEKILKDDYGNISLNPNNSLSINEILNFIESTLKSIGWNWIYEGILKVTSEFINEIKS